MSINRKLPRFAQNRDKNHLREIQKQIQLEIKQRGNSNDSFWVKFRVMVFPLFYVLLYIATLYSYPNLYFYYSGYALLGIFVVVIFLTSIHELCHDGVFKQKSSNRFFLYFFDIIGANSYIWKQRHVLMHHNYPNIKGWDTDIEQSNLFKIYADAPHTKFHKIQHYLMFVFYPLYLFNWLLIRDFKDFFKKNSTIKKSIKIPKIEYVKLIVFKMFYFFYMLFLPFWFFKIPFGMVFIGFLLHTSVASIFALFVLLPPHANLENEFVNVPDDYQIPTTWVEHQLQTTIDISNHNWFISFFMGNFNYHVAHHVMPSISYSKMKIATEVIEKYANENNLPYKKCTIWEALSSHYQLVKKNSIRQSAIFEETF